MFQPRSACASPASWPRSRELSPPLRTLRISVPRSTVGIRTAGRSISMVARDRGALQAVSKSALF